MPRLQLWRRPQPSPMRRGFTLIEMMVVITIIALLAIISVPVFQRVREGARDTQCKSNLRQLAQGLMQYSNASRNGDYCSGAWDWKRDGAVTQVGWVADLVNQGTPVGDLTCPTSKFQLSRVYRELLTLDPTTNQCADSLGGPDQTLPDGTIVSNPCRQLAGATNKGQIINDLLLQKKFNTNYVTSWFLVRTDVRLDNRGQLINAKSSACDTSRRERSCTIGPLTTNRIGGKIPANLIPMMGCGGVAEMGQNMLTESVGEFTTEEFLAESYTAGPRVPSTLENPVITASGTGPQVWFGPWNATLQDYRAFGPVHGGKERGSCNIAFIDGTVKSFVDENGDGLLNNGYPASTATGYQGTDVELPEAEVYSKWSLDPARL